MLFGCEQPFLWGERCVTSQKTAAKETRFLCEVVNKILAASLRFRQCLVIINKLCATDSNISPNEEK